MFELKRVLLLVPRLNIGGAESHVDQIARNLKKAGWDVEVASGGGALAKRLEKDGIKHHWVPVRINFSLAVWELKKILREGNFSLVHAHSNASGPVAAAACEDLKLPWIYTAHTGLRPPRIEAFRKAKKILAVSEYLEKMILDKNKDFIRPNQVAVLQNCVDCTYFSPQGDLKESREFWGLGEEYTVGIVARLRKPERKGHLDLVNLLARPGCENWRLMIIGKAHWWYGGTRKVQKLAKELGVSERIIWSGHQLDVRPCIEACDVIALPSVAESFGLALAEAMAMEKPVVAYGGTGTDEVVGSDGGVLVENQNIEALERALRSFEDSDLRKTVGLAARARIKRLYDLPTFMKKLTSFYEEAIKE